MAIMVLGGLCLLTGMAHAAEYGAVVVDASNGKVVNSVNPDQPTYPASLTKMMTLYLTFQALHEGKLHIDQQMPVSAWAANKAPTKLGLRRGQIISVRDCILGMVTKSANDAATVMAEGLGGSESHFAEMMTAQARLLGMDNTHFNNASGLPDAGQLTTARDMVKLAMALYRDFPADAHYFSTREFVFRGRLVRGHNHLMDRYPGMDGLKTGFTDASGFNLASTAVRDGHRLFGVVLGGHTAASRDDLMARLLDDSFDHQQTPAVLVAQAAGVRESATARVLAALSPIGTAQADTLPATHKATKHHRRSSKSAPALAHRTRRKGKSTSTATAARAAACTRRGAHAITCPHHRHATTKLADRTSGKKTKAPLAD
jgi:D-alanyl-D-alanine carboxypeptidase/D-alanyl-D-alanine carboxypeptidase (penicillin-binding protein 5/6)